MNIYKKVYLNTVENNTKIRGFNNRFLRSWASSRVFLGLVQINHYTPKPHQPRNIHPFRKT